MLAGVKKIKESLCVDNFSFGDIKKIVLGQVIRIVEKKKNV